MKHFQPEMVHIPSQSNKASPGEVKNNAHMIVFRHLTMDPWAQPAHWTNSYDQQSVSQKFNHNQKWHPGWIIQNCV